MSTLELILFALVWFLPAGIANMTPVIVAKIPGIRRFSQPIDFGRSFRGKRILGDHKTWRGLLLGTLAGSLVMVPQYASFYGFILPENLPAWQVRLHQINPIILGALLGFGALAGDMTESFIKRQFDIPSGKSWFPWDQIDYILGAILLSALYIQLPWGIYLTTAIVYFALHLGTSYLGYLLGFKSDPI